MGIPLSAATSLHIHCVYFSLKLFRQPEQLARLGQHPVRERLGDDAAEHLGEEVEEVEEVET